MVARISPACGIVKQDDRSTSQTDGDGFGSTLKKNVKPKEAAIISRLLWVGFISFPAPADDIVENKDNDDDSRATKTRIFRHYTTKPVARCSVERNPSTKDTKIFSHKKKSAHLITI